MGLIFFYTNEMIRLYIIIKKKKKNLSPSVELKKSSVPYQLAHSVQ